MPPTRKNTSIDEIVRDAMAPVASAAARMIAKHIASIVADQLEAQLSKAASGTKRPGLGRKARRRRPAAGGITRWVTDRRARRVPTFVIEMTGLDTKKKIVARYGEDAVFVKGKPAPAAKAAVAKAEGPVKPVVKAKPPIIRKAAAAGR